MYICVCNLNKKTNRAPHTLFRALNKRVMPLLPSWRKITTIQCIFIDAPVMTSYRHEIPLYACVRAKLAFLAALRLCMQNVLPSTTSASPIRFRHSFCVFFCSALLSCFCKFSHLFSLLFVWISAKAFGRVCSKNAIDNQRSVILPYKLKFLCVCERVCKTGNLILKSVLCK